MANATDGERWLMLSGGKDSTYLLYHCIENQIPFDKIVFVDTELELPLIYQWIDYLEERFKVTVTRITPEKTFFSSFYTKKKRGKHIGKIRSFPPITKRGCWIRTLKFSGLKGCEQHTQLIGMCADEKHRSNFQRPKTTFEFPLIEAGITQRQVIRRLKKLDLYPPLYDLLKWYGAKMPRSGCWLCPFGSIAWQRLVYFEYPALWTIWLQLERDAPFGWRPVRKISKLTIRFRKEKDRYQKQGTLSKWIGR